MTLERSLCLRFTAHYTYNIHSAAIKNPLSKSYRNNLKDITGQRLLLIITESLYRYNVHF